MRIEAWASSSGTIGWYRVLLPFQQIAAHGHSVVIRRVQNADNSPVGEWPLPMLWASDGADVDAAPDVLFAHRVSSASLVSRLTRIAQRTRVVYGLEDDVLSVGHSPTVQGPGATGLPAGNDAARIVRARATACIRAAHSVIVTTPTLATVATAHGARRVRVLPNHLPRGYLNRPAAEHPPDRLVYGWGGTDSHRGDLHTIRRPVAAAAAAHPDMHVHLVGYRDGGLWFALPPRQCRYSPPRHRWAYLTTLDFDVGLAPARPTAFNASRSDAKLLEYASRGIPAVVAPVGEPVAFVRASGAGLIAATEDDWTDALDRMRDPELRRQLSDAARTAAATRAIEDHWWSWVTALSQ